MKKYLIAATLIFGFSAPSWATETFYIMFDNSMKGHPGACSIMTSKPGGHYTMLGHYGSKSAAKHAMHSMAQCG